MPKRPATAWASWSVVNGDGAFDVLGGGEAGVDDHLPNELARAVGDRQRIRL
jgi:hypothetical protein